MTIGTMRELAKPPVAVPSTQKAAAPKPLILIFDSGVGGLSVMGEVTAHLPGFRIAYAADNFAFPYGGKAGDELIARVTDVIGRLSERIAPDAVIIACNTASTVALDAVRQIVPIPVIGVVPAVKPAAEASRTRTIGLLGTAATVVSPYTTSLIDRFAQGSEVIRCGAPELVEAAERKLQGLPVDQSAVRAVSKRLFGAPRGEAIDVVVLGCTHFPLLLPELKQAAPRSVTWMDSGAAIARRMATIFGVKPGSEPGEIASPPHRAIFTAATPSVERMRDALTGLGFGEIEILVS